MLLAKNFHIFVLFTIYSRDIELRNQKRIEKLFSPENKNLQLGLLENFLVPGLYMTSEKFSLHPFSKDIGVESAIYNCDAPRRNSRPIV